MLMFAALGPSEYVVLAFVALCAYVGYRCYSSVRRAQRKLDECHAMLTALTQAAGDRS